MSKNNFKKIKIIPLKAITDIEREQIMVTKRIKIENPKSYQKKLDSLFQYIRQNPEHIKLWTEIDEEIYLSSQIKPSSNRNRIYTFPEPDPVCIYYNIAVENLEKSFDLKNKVISNGQDYGNLQTYEDFSEYFSVTSQGIIFLITTIESFLNQFIEDKGYIINKKKTASRKLKWMKLEQKLNLISGNLLGINFKELKGNEYNQILQTNNLRNDLIHLKRVVKSNDTSYQDLFKILMDYKQVQSLDAVFTLLCMLKPNYFVEIDS